MKKRFNIVIVALALLATGCAKVDVATQEKAVSFQVGSYVPQTKAPEGTASIKLVDGITSFSSRGYLHAEGVDTEQHFFGAAGETIAYNGTNAWLPSHDYFWPKSPVSYVNFISWFGGNPTITYAKTGDVWTAGFAWSNITVAPTDNLLWADVAWRYNANAQTYLFDGVTEGVPTLFHHALSQLKFQGRASKASEGDNITWSVSVTELSLETLPDTGTMTMTSADPGTTGTSAWTVTAWSGLSGEQTLVAAALPKTLSTEAGSETLLLDWQSIIPQTVTADMVLNVKFTVTTTYKSGGATVRTVEEEVSASIPLTSFTGVTAWEMNKRYTYTLVINPDTHVITIIPVETNWVEESEYPINIE